MRPNQIYFHRNQGPWEWRIELTINDWLALWRANIPFYSKFCLSLLTLLQKAAGALRMWTRVDCDEAIEVVHHATTMKLWGLTIYRSEKRFVLDKTSGGIQLEGEEFYWPLMYVGIPFPSSPGLVDASTTRACYQMPMVGLCCTCRAFLEMPEGHITVESPWFCGRFTLTYKSNQILKERLSH